MKVDLCHGSIRSQRSVEHVKQGGIPASAGGISLNRIAAAAHDAPSISGIANSLEGVERVEQSGIARLRNSPHRSFKRGKSQIGAGVETFDDGKNFLGMVGDDQIDRALVVEQRMFRMKP